MNSNTNQEEQAQMLLKAFDSFAEVSTSLERTYLQLQSKVRSLSEQLEETNQYLNAVLLNLPCGVMVLDPDNQIKTLNARAQTLLDLPLLEVPCLMERLLEMSSCRGPIERLFEAVAGPVEVSFPGPVERVLSCSRSLMPAGEQVFVIQDLTEFRSLQKKMQKAERLAAMGEMAMELAHEIRNPLASVELFASLLKEADLSQEDHQKYVENIQIGVRSLNTVLTNMLSLSKESSPVRTEVQVSEILHEIGTFMEPLLKQRRIELNESFKGDLKMLADGGMLRQAFTNLVLNALQALPEEGRLDVEASDQGHCMKVVIRDNGIGIPEENREAIFEPHFTTNQKGNGLGLAITRRIVESHGGFITLKSAKGWGTEFTLTFPLGGPHS